MIVADYDLKKTRIIMKVDKKQEKEKKYSENEINLYDVMLEAIKFGLLPRNS